MKKATRLSSASHWLDEYEGKNIVRGYMRRYGVDELAALVELRTLGVEIPESRFDLAQKKIEDRAAQRRLAREQKEKDESPEIDDYSDEHFAYIAGIPPGARRTV